MSRQYHYLVAGFPDLLIDDNKLEPNLNEFKDQLEENLHPNDIKTIELFFNQFDNENLLKRLEDSETPLNPNGILSSAEWDEIADAARDGSIDDGLANIPAYITRFMAAHKADEPIYEDKRWELQLSELYYEAATATSNTFINQWFRFERDLKNLITAWQCRKHEIDIDNQLIGKGETVDKLSRSNARDFGLDNDFPMLEQILKALEEDDPKEFELRIDRIKWDYLDEVVFFHYFSIEKIFSFLVKISIVERWLKLDKETGRKLFNELLSNMEASYEFPDEFKLKK